MEICVVCSAQGKYLLHKEIYTVRTTLELQNRVAQWAVILKLQNCSAQWVVILRPQIHNAKHACSSLLPALVLDLECL